MGSSKASDKTSAVFRIKFGGSGNATLFRVGRIPSYYPKLQAPGDASLDQLALSPKHRFGLPLVRVSESVNQRNQEKSSGRNPFYGASAIGGMHLAKAPGA